MTVLSSIIIGLGSGVVSTLLTIILSPRLQHHFWTRQRSAELRVEVANKVNEEAGDFITGHGMFEDYSLSFQQLATMQVVEGQVKALFSDESVKSYMQMQRLIAAKAGRSRGLGPEGKSTIDDFLMARDAALRDLYKEAGITHRR
jgi:hypothetical protein